jgi:alpha,alpha-trehalase
MRHFVLGPLMWLSLFLLPCLPASSGQRSVLDCVTQEVASASETTAANEAQALELIRKRATETRYPDIPGLDKTQLPKEPPQPMPERAATLSDGMTDPVLERSRDLRVFEDFKYPSDLRKRPLSSAELARIRVEGEKLADTSGKTGAERERAFLKFFIEAAYEPGGRLEKVEGIAPPEWSVHTGDPSIDATFNYTERTWSELARRTVPEKGGSLLPSPYPILIPAGRFQESYYWDSYFGAQGLLATGRIDLASMQVENLLESVRRYGFVPNGGRDYYLSRSQPPVLSSYVRDVFEAKEKSSSEAEKTELREWLKARAYPLLRLDYENFWMDPKTRYDSKTGLNHHWDDLNSPRPERHGADQESKLGTTYRDVRAAAESGMDFTKTFGKDASRVAGVLLNSMLYKTETDLAWMAELLGEKSDVDRFRQAAQKRQSAMDRYLWDSKRGAYENYRLDQSKRIGAVSGDLFSTLFAKVANASQAKRIVEQLSVLEAPGGIRASNIKSSTHQWDGDNGWAPFQFFAIDGLRNYGYTQDAKRIATKWVKVNAKVHAESGALFERVDVAHLSKPETDTTKYPPQSGFLWTNGIFNWALIDVLGARLEPLAH